VEVTDSLGVVDWAQKNKIHRFSNNSHLFSLVLLTILYTTVEKTQDFALTICLISLSVHHFRG